MKRSIFWLSVAVSFLAVSTLTVRLDRDAVRLDGVAKARAHGLDFAHVFCRAKKFFDNVGKKIKKGFQDAGKWIQNKIIKPVGQAFKKAGEAIKKGFQAAGRWIKQKIIEPAGKAFKAAGKWIKDKIIDPVIQFGKKVIGGIRDLFTGGEGLSAEDKRLMNMKSTRWLVRAVSAHDGELRRTSSSPCS